MTGLEELKQRLRVATVPTVFACLFLYTGYHLVQGQHGVLAYLKAQESQAKAIEVYERTYKERLSLENQVDKLRPEGVDPDLLDERARLLLGRVHPNDLIIPRAYLSN